MPLFPRSLVLAGCCACAILALVPSALRAQGGPVTHPQGEWYDAGYQMAQEARSSFHVLGVPDEETIQRLTRLLRGMGIKASEHKTSDIALLQQGWEDGIMGRAEALIYPPDQQRSILPARLRGFHEFPGDLEDQRRIAEEARKAAEEAKKPKSLAEMAARWKRSIVKVLPLDIDGESLGHGTGFFIGPGLLVTNNHVVDGGEKFAVQIESDQALHHATLIATTKVPDIALLEIDWKKNAFLPVGDSDRCRELEEVVMIGYPEFINFSATYVKGAISATRRPFRTSKHQFECLQLDIRANHGNSGGPIISLDGHVVGILTFGLGGVDASLSQFTFAQRTAWVLPFLQKYASGRFTYE